MDQPPVPQISLAERLRTLREREHRRLTQEQLASVFRSRNSTVSSWEKPGPDRLPPPERLAEYARLFCTSRSFDSGNLRLLRDDELDKQELQRKAELYAELLLLREQAQSAEQGQPREAAAPTGEESSSIWRFPDGAAITIVCADANEQPPYAKPDHLNYTRFARYADLDALIAVHGQIKADNPKSDVWIMPIEEFEAEDTERHVVIIGGKAADDPATSLLCSKLLLPRAEKKEYKKEHKTWDSHIFRFRFDREDRTFEASFDDNTLIRDVGVFARGSHPVGQDLTVTVCNGITSRGVYGAALCFIDSERNPKESQRKLRNEQYVKEQLGGVSTYCIFMNITVFKGKAVPPYLSDPDEVWCYPR